MTRIYVHVMFEKVKKQCILAPFLEKMCESQKEYMKMLESG